MVRKVRIQYPGAVYHVMKRGDRREAIFEDAAVRQRLLETLSEACQKTGRQVHAYCLMHSQWGIPKESAAGRPGGWTGGEGRICAGGSGS
jgi:putative transposase